MCAVYDDELKHLIEMCLDSSDDLTPNEQVIIQLNRTIAHLEEKGDTTGWREESIGSLKLVRRQRNLDTVGVKHENKKRLNKVRIGWCCLIIVQIVPMEKRLSKVRLPVEASK